MSISKRFPLSRQCRRCGRQFFVSTVLTALLASILTLGLLPAGPVMADSPADQANASFQKGMSYAAYWSGDYATPGGDRSLELLAETGANWIALIVTGHQDIYTSTTINRTHESTPTDEELIHVIQKAHSLGLKVMLKPHVDLYDEITGGYWRGDIGTGFTNEAQWAAWFSAYREFIQHYASMAQTYGAEQFCVGTELQGTTYRANDWRAVVAGVRGIYSGPIVYAANQGGEEVSITWWDAVDIIGVDGYYILNDDIDIHPTVAYLEAQWAEPKQLLANLSATYGKPIIFTEIGYRSHHGCSSHPWDWWTPSELDLEEQANAYEAAFRQVYNEPWMHGIFWWMWSTDRFSSGPCDVGFSPHQKPAENVLRFWYGAPPMSSSSNPVLLPDNSVKMDIFSEGLATGWQNWSWWTPVLDMAATNPVYSGSQSMAVQLNSWGAVSLWRPAFDQSPYHWLEFQIRGDLQPDQHLVVYLTTEDGVVQDEAPVDDCRIIADGTIDGDTWKQARILLSDLNRSGQRVNRITIQDRSSGGSTFWIDDLQLIGAQESSHQVMLPVVVSG